MQKKKGLISQKNKTLYFSNSCVKNNIINIKDKELKLFSIFHVKNR